MVVRDFTWVVLSTCFLLLVLDRQTASFRLGDRIKDYSGLSLEEKINSSLNAAVIPSYLQELLKVSENGTFEGEDFLEKLLDGVTSDSCKAHVTKWFDIMGPNSLKKENTWAWQMVDAWGKLPEGILAGHVNSFGDFDECVQIQVEGLKIEGNGKISKSFEGQYCTSYILDYGTAMMLTPKPIGPAAKQITQENKNGIQEAVSLEEFFNILRNPTPNMIMMLPSVGVCLPNSCTLVDVQQILVNGMNMVYSQNPGYNPETSLWPVTINCADSHKPSLDGPAITVIILLSVLVTLALVAAVIDYWYSEQGEAGCGAPDNMGYRYLMAFSLYTNTRKWMSTRKSGDDLGCLHGIRFLSTAWVVLAHTYFVFISGPQWNMIDVKNIHKDWSVMAVINGTFSVDTFFVMSGLLATYNILKLLDRSQGKFNVIMFYIHRYIRLTPTYAILVGIGATLISYAGNGPNYFAMKTSEDHCRKNWWTNILYVNNLVNSGEMCNGESWYLANDMQFYILSPLIVYPIWKWEMVGMSLLTLYTMLSCIAPVLVVRFADAPAAMVMTGNMGTGTAEIYFRPWSRISTFLVGVWLGVLLHKTRGKRVSIPKAVVPFLWLLSTAIALTLIFAIQPWFDPANKIPDVAGYFYAGLSRFAWGVVISWVIFACVKGHGGIVNRFLSWSVFMPLGRLCFCVYLTSIHLQSIFHSRLTVPIKWDNYTVVNLFFSHMVMSYLVGFVCTMLFESPFIVLQKLIFEKNNRGVLPKNSPERNNNAQAEKSGKE